MVQPDQPGSQPVDDPQPSWLKALRGRLSLPSIETGSSTLRTVSLNILFLLMLVLVTPVLVSQFWRDQVIIEPIAVPPALAARGFTENVAASRLWDGILDVQAAARTAKKSLAAIPDARQVQFSFPDSGLSIESFIFHLRGLVGIHETRIGGEFVCGSESCESDDLRLRIRIVRDRVDLIDLSPGAVEERAFFAEAARRILALLDPFVAAASMSETDPQRATVLARHLIRQGHPDAMWAHNLIGNIRGMAGDHEAAVVEYQRALALDRDFDIARANLAGSLVEAGHLERAKAELVRLRHADGVAATIEEVKANLALKEGRVDDAIAALEEAMRNNPLSPNLPTRAGLIARQAGQKERARDFFNAALDMDPGFPGALAALALDHMEQQDHSAAERLYRDAADYSPDDASLLSQHGRLLMILRRHEEALERFGQAITVADVPEYRRQRVEALQALGRHQEAATEIEAAIAATPSDAELHLALGNSLRELGDASGAVVAYKRFLELDREGSIMRPMAERWVELLAG